MQDLKIARRYPLNITIFTVLQNARKGARKLVKEAKKPALTSTGCVRMRRVR